MFQKIASYQNQKFDSMVIEFEPVLKKNINFKSIKTLEYITNIFSLIKGK